MSNNTLLLACLPGPDAAQNLIRYAGALFVPTSSNYSTFGARWYNAYTAAFSTQDTNSYLANPENGNRYAYASGNPINYTDPTGACSLDSIVTDATGIVGGGTVVGGIAYASFFTEASVGFALGITGLLGGGIVALGAAAGLGLCLAGD